jgi:hypothetical protein
MQSLLVSPLHQPADFGCNPRLPYTHVPDLQLQMPKVEEKDKFEEKTIIANGGITVRFRRIQCMHHERPKSME